MNRMREWKIWKDFSEKGYNFSVRKKGYQSPQEPLEKITSVTEGQIVCRSGYLVACNEIHIDVVLSRTQIPGPRDIIEKPITKIGENFHIDYNSFASAVPNIMQFDNDFVGFRNLWGDGMFAVLSSPNRYYVESYPCSFDDELTRDVKNGKTEEKKGSRIYHLEGLVGIGGGRMGIVDPTLHSVSRSEHPEKCFELFTVLKVEPGTYGCRFIDNHRKLSIRRISDN